MREQAMLSKAPGQNDLQYFNVDDNKACINKKMHDSDQGIAEHFLLAKCKQQNIFPSLGWVIRIIFIMAQQNIAPDLFYILCKKPYRKKGNCNKYDLLNNQHANGITGLR